jgi:Ca2+-binding EF-hand superfamily protein
MKSTHAYGLLFTDIAPPPPPPQIKRNHVIQQERKRLWEFVDPSLRESVVHFMQAMVAAGDSQLWRQLIDVGVPERTIHLYFSAPEQPNGSWSQWRQKHCVRQSGGGGEDVDLVEADDEWREKTGPAEVLSRNYSNCRSPHSSSQVSAEPDVTPDLTPDLTHAEPEQKMAELLDIIGPEVSRLRAVFSTYAQGSAQSCEGSAVMKILWDCGVERDLSDLRRQLTPLGVSSSSKVTFATFLRCYAAAVGLDGPHRGAGGFLRTEPGVWATVPTGVRKELVKVFSSFADTQSRTMQPSLLVDALRMMGVEAHPMLVERHTELDGGSLSLEDFARAFLFISKRVAELVDSSIEGQISTDDAGMKRVFDRFDQNGDGTIDAKELRCFFERGGGEVDEATIQRWIHLRDRSGTGTVSFADFATFYRMREGTAHR